MNRNILLYSIVALISTTFGACNSENKPKPQLPKSNSNTIIEVENVPVFMEDSAYEYIQQQVDFGPRVPGTLTHKKCGDFLVQKLKSFGPNSPVVSEQNSTAKTFDNFTIPIRNIIASFNPNHSNRILLAAHWDTRPFAEMDVELKNKPIDGANDGASGVGVLLEIARQLAIEKPEIGIDIIFFDAEDWGDTTGATPDSYCLGSQYWAQNPHVPNYTANFGILLDMVGGKNALFAIEENSWKMASTTVSTVWSTAQKLGFGDMFINQKRGPIIDDHYYVMLYRRFPMVDIINYDPNSYSRFGHFWHTHQDNMFWISPKTLKAVGQTVLQVVYQENANLTLK